MSFQPSLLDQRTDTSAAVYRDVILPTLSTRQAAVLAALRACRVAPTAYELFKSMQRAGTAHDLNDVRPRLTELQGRGVERQAKRPCTVTGHTAYTWALTEAM